ncbi:type IV toxin-antitoxin system AbiEi family antitoxin domain-containing protein [Nocardioides sp.]|uniref:type IV toxin-antitoxin system AbiEi family antitoxin domain-containing protein n=1 Tax=Nocardioides sp. TaxID=35761 RepID=UPI0039E2239B
MAVDGKYRDLVREIALGEYGYVTTKDAAEAGVPPVELRKLAARGALVSVAYGIYRVPDAPATPFDQFAEALLRAGDGSYLRGDSVLALFGLADVNPRRVRVVAPRRTRAKMPAFVEVTTLSGTQPQLTHYQGLRAMTVAEALLDCRGRIERSRLLEAARDARKEGLLTREEYTRVQRELRHTRSADSGEKVRTV